MCVCVGVCVTVKKSGNNRLLDRLNSPCVCVCGRACVCVCRRLARALCCKWFLLYMQSHLSIFIHTYLRNVRTDTEPVPPKQPAREGGPSRRRL